MSDHGHPEPQQVAQMVEDYVQTSLSNAKQFSNSTPLDESGVYSLHRLAAAIYAAGWRDGHLAGTDAQHRAARRAREAEESS